MRRNARVDANQKAITKALRALGVSVEPLHFAGRGVADLLCGFQNETYLIEVKDGAKSPSQRKLTPDEYKWQQEWRGSPVYIIESVEQAIELFVGQNSGKMWKHRDGRPGSR